MKLTVNPRKEMTFLVHWTIWPHMIMKAFALKMYLIAMSQTKRFQIHWCHTYTVFIRHCLFALQYAYCLASNFHIFYVRSEFNETQQTNDDEKIRNRSTQQSKRYLLVDVNIRNLFKYFHYSSSESNSSSESYQNMKLRSRSTTNVQKELQSSDLDSENCSNEEVSESAENSDDVNLNNCLKKGIARKYFVNLLSSWS